ncbi:YqaA family protein [Emcibacter sp. SYSU 3D8]|uniref:YqaA family protein n=1 Tax=Emcibacter sp. SYSU 3D8 TaxID=3133969 RepID=UPI0031FE9B71
MTAPQVEPVVRRGPLRRLYLWTMEQARGRHAWTSLGAVSFAESSFFPIPPDVMLLPMMLADRKRAFLLAGWCTLASVLGGMAGYAIGMFLFDSVGNWLVSLYGYEQKMEALRLQYAEYGAWIILIKGATPIPYKLITIASGIFHYPFGMFVLLSVITRSARFFLLAGLIYLFGDPIRDFIEKRLEWVMMTVVVAIVGGFVIAHYLL